MHVLKVDRVNEENYFPRFSLILNKLSDLVFAIYLYFLDESVIAAKFSK